MDSTGGVIGLVSTAVLALGGFAGKLIMNARKRAHDLEDLEIAERRKQTAQWHTDRENEIQRLRRKVEEQAAELRETDRSLAAARVLIEYYKRTSKPPEESTQETQASLHKIEPQTAPQLPLMPPLPRPKTRS